MKKSEFFFNLPPEKIAQNPIKRRDLSKLLVLDRLTGEIKHMKFFNLQDILEKGDCLVLNNSRVFPARIYGKNEKTAAELEFLLIKQKEKDLWEVLCRPAKRARLFENFNFSGMLKGKIIEIFEDGRRFIKFSYEGNFYSILEKIGHIPLPPYIKKDLKDSNRYQTIYSKEIGSVAAPTAGLHFTKEMLSNLERNGVLISYITLHVGLGTFLPVKEEKIENHKMHSEMYFVSEKEAEKINIAKRNGKKVYCVGTTSCRTIESVYIKKGKICEDEGTTNIFIYPGFRFNVMDALITNFHLPQSSLIMLVSAFAGHENTMKSYKIAIENDYRFFSFGDAMLIK